MLPIEINDMTREELIDELERIGEGIPGLKADYDQKAAATREARAAVDAAKKLHNQAWHISGRAETVYRFSLDRYNTLRRALEDLTAREESPNDWPIVRSKPHGQHPVKSRR